MLRHIIDFLLITYLVLILKIESTEARNVNVNRLSNRIIAGDVMFLECPFFRNRYDRTNFRADATIWLYQAVDSDLSRGTANFYFNFQRLRLRDNTMTV